MRLIIQDVPPSLNKLLRMHWAKRRKLCTVWAWGVRAAFGTKNKALSKKKVRIVLFHARLYDKDNAYGACKIIFDAMKACGLIVDDSAQWLDCTVEQQKYPHKKRYTTIEIEEANNE